jgi:hypothetical protein
MVVREVLEISAVILGSIGGAAAIIFGLSSWLGKVWADRLMRRETAEFARELEEIRRRAALESESYKIRLKKSEFLFQREFAAASEFVALVRSVMPRREWPGMEWNDVYDFIASDFDKIEDRLDEFLATHGAVLRNDVVEHIVRCLQIAGDSKFSVIGNEVSEEANSAAGRLYEELKAAENGLLDQVRSQTST